MCLNHETPAVFLTNQIIEQLRTSGRVDRPQLGMRLVTVDAREAKDTGVMVSWAGRRRAKGGGGVLIYCIAVVA